MFPFSTLPNSCITDGLTNTDDNDTTSQIDRDYQFLVSVHVLDR